MKSDIAACIHQHSILQQRTLKATSNTWQRYTVLQSKSPSIGLQRLAGWNREKASTALRHLTARHGYPEPEALNQRVRCCVWKTLDALAFGVQTATALRPIWSACVMYCSYILYEHSLVFVHFYLINSYIAKLVCNK